MLGDRLAQRFVVAAALAVADEGGAGDGGHVLHTHEDAKGDGACPPPRGPVGRSEEHTSELQSLMRISYAVFCLKKKPKQYTRNLHTNIQNCRRSTTSYERHAELTT